MPAEATVTLVNQHPVPVIEVVSTNVWVDEATVLSAETSTDADGSIVAYRWTWEGGATTGERPTVVVSEATTITLTITDSNGAEANTTVRLVPSAGPSVQNLQAVHDGRGQVTMTWTWTGDVASFNVLRNGERVATTNEMTHVDLPLMSGLNTYTVQPRRANVPEGDKRGGLASGRRRDRTTRTSRGTRLRIGRLHGFPSHSTAIHDAPRR